MKGRLANLWELLRSSYWFVPALMTLGAIALSSGTIALDTMVQRGASTPLGLIWGGSPDGARGLLSTVANSMLSVAGVTFSITIASLSLASAQFGPHLLRTFMRDTSNQFVLGTFVATYIYCLLVLRTVRGGDGPEFVPHISVTISVALALAGIGVLIYFIHHIASSIQAPHVIAAVNADLEKAIERLFPQQIGAEPAETPDAPQAIPVMNPHDARNVVADRDGYVQLLDTESLIALAVEHDLILQLQHRPGDFVVKGAPLLLAWPAGKIDDHTCEQIAGKFIIGSQGTLTQDVTFTINQMVQIGVRALSPGINDPFTAAICIDWLSAALCRLAATAFPSPYRYDQHGQLRVIVQSISFTELIDSAFDPIRRNAQSRSSLLVTLRLLEALTVIAGHVRSEEAYRAVQRHARDTAHGIQAALREQREHQAVERYHQEIERILDQRLTHITSHVRT